MCLGQDFTTHSLFDNTDVRIVDEWTFCQYQNKSVALAALEKHWSTYITEDDFRQIQEAGCVPAAAQIALLRE